MFLRPAAVNLEIIDTYRKIIGFTRAYQAGFDDPYYFSRVFKKKTGKSPTEWLNQPVG